MFILPLLLTAMLLLFGLAAAEEEEEGIGFSRGGDERGTVEDCDDGRPFEACTK